MHATKHLFSLIVLMSVSSGFQSLFAASPTTKTNRWAQRAADPYPWHGSYRAIQYGQPVAVIAPPTAHMRQSYSWGVSQNTNHPIYHQFGRSYPGYGFSNASGFRYAPAWPSHTDQFGGYYIRGPW